MAERLLRICILQCVRECQYFKITKIEIKVKIRIIHCAEHHDLSVVSQDQANQIVGQQKRGPLQGEGGGGVGVQAHLSHRPSLRACTMLEMEVPVIRLLRHQTVLSRTGLEIPSNKKKSNNNKNAKFTMTE